jgi:hypothetical protein
VEAEIVDRIMLFTNLFVADLVFYRDQSRQTRHLQGKRLQLGHIDVFVPKARTGNGG